MKTIKIKRETEVELQLPLFRKNKYNSHFYMIIDTTEEPDFLNVLEVEVSDTNFLISYIEHYDIRQLFSLDCFIDCEKLEFWKAFYKALGLMNDKHIELK